MPIGVIVNVLSVIIGGFIGSTVGGKFPEKLKQVLTDMFGVCSLGMGISSIMLIKYIPTVIFAIIAGTAIGTLLDLDGRIRRGTGRLLESLHINEDLDTQLLLTAIVLFCAGGTGIYGALVSGISGDHSILIAKSVLDFFTAMIFACQLKKVVIFISIPQLVILLLLFFSAKMILPLTNESMIADFQACGGIILLATGFVIMKVKDISLINMLPSMLLVMPISALWMNVLLPLIV